jgi:hypothetical protein
MLDRTYLENSFISPDYLTQEFDKNLASKIGTTVDAAEKRTLDFF